MNIFNFFKPSKNEECVKFSDQLQWVFFDYKYKHPDIFDDLITIYYDTYMGRPPIGWFLLNKKFLISYRCSYHTLESVHIDIYLVDNTFKYELNKNIYSWKDNFCYPQVIMKNEVVLDGPWINEIKTIFDSKNVKESIINQRNKEKEERLQYELKEKRQKECCENKKKNILNNYR